jgi:hypothetical protein
MPYPLCMESKLGYGVINLNTNFLKKIDEAKEIEKYNIKKELRKIRT